MLKVVRNLICCVCLLFAFSILVFSGNSANADTVDYIVNVAPSLNITLSSNNVVLDLNPNTKTSDSKDLNIKVSTNNMTGYQLTMSSAGDATDLVRDNTADGKNAVIPTLSSEAGATAASLTDNTWGYKKDSGNFIPYVSNTKLLENKYATNKDETTLSFASKINYNQAAGSYELALVLTGVANPMMYYMQDLNPTFCTTAPMTVLDNRDMQEYTIQRLADGNCWMMTNLNLGAVDLETDLTTSNTNLQDTITAVTFNSWKKTVGTQTLTTAEFIPLNTSNTSNGLDTDPVSQTPYGTLYNFCAASAGTICSNPNSSNATYDICPVGWRLPTGGSTGEIQKLYEQSAYNTNTKMRASIANGGAAFALAGSFDTTPVYQGTDARIWSSTRYDDDEMYDLFFNMTQGVYPTNHNYNRYGIPIRCILKDTRTISDITYMQDINSNIIANTANNSTATLTDIRDGQRYTVAKINGKVWMTRNLAIGCNGANTAYGDTIAPIELTPATSNVSSNWTTPASSLSSVGDDYINPLIECSATYGAWYNYAAATAGDIAGSSNITRKASYDVCPSGWRLATHSEQTGIVSYASLYNGVLGGYWKNKQRTDTIYGWQWSSEYGTSMQYYLIRWDGSALDAANRSGYRSSGNYVRCIAK
ncbi:hypothetical protein IKG07_00145 [Candidatus Saccharibacteria bacterium]|nr:hypothetical protein [Candidatus Saccharibacteria bacterium]